MLNELTDAEEQALFKRWNTNVLEAMYPGDRPGYAWMPERMEMDREEWAQLHNAVERHYSRRGFPIRSLDIGQPNFLFLGVAMVPRPVATLEQLSNLRAHVHIRNLAAKVTASRAALEEHLWQKLIDRFALSLETWGYAS